MLPFNLVILGPQGSGKGTQARLISERYKMPNLGAGELIRKKAEENTDEGRKIKAINDVGELIPVATTKKIIEEALMKVPQTQTVIFEGYPRTMEQVKDFEDILTRRKISAKKIITLIIDEDTALQRIQGRRVCADCEKNYYPPDSLSKKQCMECGGKLIQRADDTENAIKKRLSVYQNETKPVIEYFRKCGELIEIDGEPSIEKVNQEIVKKLEGES